MQAMECKAVIHTFKEWLELPDEVSELGVWYVYSDFRTDNNINVARFKFGDGITKISKLPFVTAAITENDIAKWDKIAADEGNSFGKIIQIDETLKKYTFPSDGYLTLEFEGSGIDYAEVRIYGARGNAFFTLNKSTDRDKQSKEVFVKEGMKVEYIAATKHAKIKFIPLI